MGLELDVVVSFEILYGAKMVEGEDLSICILQEAKWFEILLAQKASISDLEGM